MRKGALEGAYRSFSNHLTITKTDVPIENIAYRPDSFSFYLLVTIIAFTIKINISVRLRRRVLLFITYLSCSKSIFSRNNEDLSAHLGQ